MHSHTKEKKRILIETINNFFFFEFYMGKSDLHLFTLFLFFLIPKEKSDLRESEGERTSERERDPKWKNT